MSFALLRTTEGRPPEFGLIYPPDHGWLAKAPAEEVLFPDLPVVDPHHHLWEHPGFRYLLDEFAEDTAGGHNVVATVYTDCLTAYRTDGPEALRPVGETEFAATVAARAANGPVAVGAGITGFADLRLGAAVEEVLTAHIAAGEGRFRGTRFATSYDGDPGIENSHTGSVPGMLADPEVRKGAAVLRDLGLTLDTWVFFHQLDEVAGIADALPDLPIVLDHCGGPLGYARFTGRREAEFDTWRRGVRAVAERPNVNCKIGGLVARLAAFDYRTAERPASSTELAALWRPYIETCIETFGPDRCMFESNYPVDKVAVPYRTLWNTYKRVTEGMTDGERADLFAGTARRVYAL
ncbi:amidohydrolase family protein [Pseudonocardia ailaonensis]|uniref:Amidohydrolase family protein n=1 Tax=Pseudonocardia ailaonensis TaxID=367279 RepID=A0ABN2NA75_9PSEU